MNSKRFLNGRTFPRVAGGGERVTGDRFEKYICLKNIYEIKCL